MPARIPHLSSLVLTSLWSTSVAVLCLSCDISRAQTKSRQDLERLVREVGGKLRAVRSEDGIELFKVDLSKTTAGDATLRDLLDFPIVEIELTATQITDSGLKALGRQALLKHLDLSATNITSRGLKEITKLKGLEHLYLFDTPISEAGVDAINELRLLKVLWLDGKGCTDQVVKKLSANSNLKILILTNSLVSADTVAFLRNKLPDLVVVQK